MKYDIGSLLCDYQEFLIRKYSLSFDQDKALKDLIKCCPACGGGRLVPVRQMAAPT